MGRKTILLILLLSLVTLPLVAFGCSDSDSYRHYESKELCFSLDYPKGWICERVTLSSQIFAPGDSGYNGIYVISERGLPIATSIMASTMRTVIDEFCAQIGTADYEITSNASASGIWDWFGAFKMVYDGMPLEGRVYFTQSQTVGHTVAIVQYGFWPEGDRVLKSFASFCP